MLHIRRRAVAARVPPRLFLFLTCGLVAPRAALADSVGPLLKPEAIEDETYTESFVAMADLDNGGYLKVQLGVSNAGPGDGKGACRIYLADESGPPLSRSLLVEREGWSFNDVPRPALRMGPACAMIASENGFSVHASIEGASIDVEIEGSAAKSRRIVHSARSEGGGFYDLEVLIPWAVARATYARPGTQPRSISGHAYADHSRANALPKKTAKQWVRFRALSDKSSQLILVRFPPNDRPIVGWRWEQPAEAPVSLTRAALSELPNEGGIRAWKVMLDGPGGPWRITSHKLVQRDAPLEEGGAATGLIGKLIGNPVTYTYRAVLESKLRPEKLQGLLEVTLTDE